MAELDDIINKGVAIAEVNRQTMSTIKEFQNALMEFSKENDIPKLVAEIMEKHPEKRPELQKIVLAFHCEGKRVEDSLIR